MDITWYGYNCFRLTERGQISVVTDPYGEDFGLEIPHWKADVVTVSQAGTAFNNVNAVKGVQHVVDRPGEYEIGGVFIYGIPLHTWDETTEQATYNVAHSIYYGDVSVLHLGNLNHVPNQEDIEAIGQVDAVLVPIGGGACLNVNQASEVIALIEPSYIVPMQYAIPGLSVELAALEKFLKVMGVSRVEETDSLRVTSSGLPEQPQVVVLQPNI